MNNIKNNFNSMIINSNQISKLVLNNSYELIKPSKIEININYRNNIIKPLYALQLMFNKKPLIIKAKKSVASFNLREGTITSYKLTIRSNEMYSFLDVLFKIVLPRLNTKNIYIDSKSNVNIGIPDIKVFPQIEYEYDRLSSNIGANISIILNKKDKKRSTLFISDLLKYNVK